MPLKSLTYSQKRAVPALFGEKMLLFFIISSLCVFTAYQSGASAASEPDGAQQRFDIAHRPEDVRLSSVEAPAEGRSPEPIKGLSDAKELFSPSVSEKFYETATALIDSNNPTIKEKQAAMILLLAAAELGNTAGNIEPEILELASGPGYTLASASPADANTQTPKVFTAQGNFDMVKTIVQGYLDESSDLEPARKAIRYLLESLDEREQRERLLSELVKQTSGKNPVIESELATLLGLLAAEKADIETATSYFLYAYDKNKYNCLAFAKLVELMGDNISAASYLGHLRILLAENPLNIEAALGFAQYAQSLQLYEPAEGAYQYCEQLQKYLNPSDPLPDAIYLAWSINSYNTQRSKHKALSIAEQIRRQGRFNVFLEAIAARAAQDTGDSDLSKQILSRAQDEALQGGLVEQRPEDYQRLAWFYCFAQPDADKAINWANKAYSTDPNSIASAALLAYALAINNQAQMAKLLVENYQYQGLVELAKARIELQNGQAAEAIKRLRGIIETSPISIEAELARELLAEQGSEYIPASQPDVILAAVENDFEYKLIPEFRSPAEVVGLQLNLKGTKFSYSSPLDGTIAITNNSSVPIIITDDGLFRGNIRIDVNISGDMQAEIPNLVSMRFFPTSPIKPGASVLVPVRLLRGRLRQILLSSPQASLQIEFTAVLEPVVGQDGTVSSTLGVAAARAQVNRLGVEIDTKFLQNRFDSLSKGRQGQKIKAAKLFAGLLAEQHKMSGTAPLYRFMYADWMPELLKSALVHNLRNDDWVVRVYTMADILNIPLDYEMISAISYSLNDTQYWPARLMALYLLSKSQDGGFSQVLEWNAKNDPNKLVRNMALILAKAGEPQ